MPKRTANDLTAIAVRKLKAPETGRVEHFDGKVTGLAVRISSADHRSWVVHYRLAGRSQRYTIGNCATTSLAEARDAAIKVLAKVRDGQDPNAAKKAARLRKPDADLFKSVVELFIERYAKEHQQKSWRETERIFKNYVTPKWRHRPIGEIARRDVIALLDGIADRAPLQANRTLSAIRKLFNWSVSRDIIQASPCYLVEAPAKEIKRDRVLTDVEIEAVWGACKALGYPFGPYFQFLIATGQRRSEVASLQWPDIKGDLWNLDREATKADRAHTVPLSPLALEILDWLPKYNGGYFVFSGTNGATPVGGFSRAKARLDATSEVTGWRIHDIRRSVATGMSRLGIDRLVISKILNHADQSVTAIYDRNEFNDQKRHALETWSRKLQSLIDPDADAGKVVSLSSGEAR